jgi:hypothetical protein
MLTPEFLAKFLYPFELEMDGRRLYSKRLHSCDETGMTIVQYKHTKVIGKRPDIHPPRSGNWVPHQVQQPRKALFSPSNNFSTEEYKARNYERGSNRFDLRLSPLRVDQDGSLYTSSNTKTYLREC